VSLVIPVFNEEESLPALFSALDAALPALPQPAEVVLVDDGSRDRSFALLKDAAATRAWMRVVRFRRNFGQTAAIAAGIDESRAPIIVPLDADLQNDPTDIPRLLAELDRGFDVVSGWRRDRKDKAVSRRLPSMVANALIGRVTGVRIHDYGCTLKAYRREVIQDVRLYGEMHRFIPALAHWVGGKVIEVPVNHHARQFGKSKYGIGRTLRVFLDLLTVNFLLRYSTGPMQILGKIGFQLGFFGALLLGTIFGLNLFATLSDIQVWGWDLVKRPVWPIMGFMLLGFGIQFIGLGLISEMMIRTYHESQDKRIYNIREERPPQVAD
jgi:glycosyltransferase involved in cell wall biosynthesis